MTRRTALILVAVLGCLHVALGWAFIRASAPTYDEPLHLVSGYTYLQTGDLRLDKVDHPVLAQMWEALPLYLSRPSLKTHPELGSPVNVQQPGERFLVENALPADEVFARTRLFGLLTWTALLLAVLVLWAKGLSGWDAAVWTAFFFAWTPGFLANSALTTTDAACTAFYCAAFFCAYRSTLGPRRWAWTALSGVMAGLAMASKYSMAVLPALLAALYAWDSRRDWRARLPSALLQAAAAWACCAVTLALVYRFSQLPLYWEGMRALAANMAGGKSSFLAGRISPTGFWLYFPTALAVKTPVPTLLLGLGAAAWLARRDRGPAFTWAVLPMAAYFAAATASKFQIGYRHMLPALPMLVLLAGCAAARLSGKGRAFLAGTLLLGAWQAASVLRSHPHYLSYFNELVGGPRGGHKILLDSNLDWGQGLKPLGEELRRMGSPPVFLSYFGTADPAWYGISHMPFINVSSGIERPTPKVFPAASGKVLLAVSATNLHGVYIRPSETWGWLLKRRPLSTPGYSMFLYDLSDDPEGVGKLADMLIDSQRFDEAVELLEQAERNSLAR